MAGRESEEHQRGQDAETFASSPLAGGNTTQHPDGPGPALEDVIARLDVSGGNLPNEAIRDARRLRPQIIPRLIELIQRAAEAARNGQAISTNGPFFALYLLAEFQAKEALPAILDAMRVPKEANLFGDAISMDFNRMLAVLAVDDQAAIRELVDDKEAIVGARWEAANTYKFWVRDSLMTRAAAVELLRQHLIKALCDEDTEIVGPLVCCLGDLGAVEAERELKEAFDRDLVDPWLIDRPFLESQLAEADETFQDEIEKCPPSGIADTIKELSKWLGFQEKEFFRSPFTPIPSPIESVPAPTEHQDRFQPKVKPSVTIRSGEPHVGRNDPCPCGSGKKYKKCCGLNRS